MTTATLVRRNTPDAGGAPPSHRELVAAPLSAAVLAASEVVVYLGLGDARWDELGPLLTAFVDAARRAAGLGGSPIGPREEVTPMLRLRDLARLAERTASSTGTSVTATPLVTSSLRSLQSAARRCPSG